MALTHAPSEFPWITVTVYSGSSTEPGRNRSFVSVIAEQIAQMFVARSVNWVLRVVKVEVVDASADRKNFWSWNAHISCHCAWNMVKSSRIARICFFSICGLQYSRMWCETCAGRRGRFWSKPWRWVSVANSSKKALKNGPCSMHRAWN